MLRYLIVWSSNIHLKLKLITNKIRFETVNCNDRQYIISLVFIYNIIIGTFTISNLILSLTLYIVKSIWEN